MSLEDLKKLCDAATPGDWNCYQMAEGTQPTGYFYLGSPRGSEGGMTVADASFIAASRTAMPKLLKLAEAAKAYGKEIGFRSYSEDYHGSSYCEIMADLATDLEEALKALESE